MSDSNDPLDTAARPAVAFAVAELSGIRQTLLFWAAPPPLRVWIHIAVREQIARLENGTYAPIERSRTIAPRGPSRYALYVLTMAIGIVLGADAFADNGWERVRVSLGGLMVGAIVVHLIASRWRPDA